MVSPSTATWAVATEGSRSIACAHIPRPWPGVVETAVSRETEAWQQLGHPGWSVLLVASTSHLLRGCPELPRGSGRSRVQVARSGRARGLQDRRASPPELRPNRSEQPRAGCGGGCLGTCQDWTLKGRGSFKSTDFIADERTAIECYVKKEKKHPSTRRTSAQYRRPSAMT